MFRLRTGETGEFLHAGIESIGRRDAAAADAEVVALALEGLAALGAPPLALKLGDMGLLETLLEALGVGAAAKRRVMRAIVSGRRLEGLAEPAGQGIGEHAGLLAAIEGQAPQAARAFVEDILAIAGIDRRRPQRRRDRGALSRPGREPLGHPAGRDQRRARPLPCHRRRPGRRGGGDPVACPRCRARPRAAIDRLEVRTGFMEARGIDLSTFRFAADFGRSLDYYTGFIFEITDTRRAASRSSAEAAMTACCDGSARPTSRPSAARSGSSASDGRHERRAARPCGPLEGPPAGARRGLLRPGGVGLVARPRRPRIPRGHSGVDVEILFLSASEIVAQLASGGAHLGVTGEDLLREGIADRRAGPAPCAARLRPCECRGRVPKPGSMCARWPISTMSPPICAPGAPAHAGRDQICESHPSLLQRARLGRLPHRREPRGDRRRAGLGRRRDLVDITTTGATLAANALKRLDDGAILRCEANLVASIGAEWGGRARAAARTLLTRIAAEEEARTTREIRAAMDPDRPLNLQDFARLATLPYGAARGVELVLRCPKERVFEVVEALVAAGARDVTVGAVDYVFRPGNPLPDRLFARLP